MNINDLDKKVINELHEKAKHLKEVEEKALPAFKWAKENAETIKAIKETIENYRKKQDDASLKPPFHFEDSYSSEFLVNILTNIEMLIENGEEQLVELQLQTENNKKAASSSTFWAIVAIIIALISLVISLKDLILLPLMK